MAQSLHKTKRRIASVNSTKKITKAMELVASVKFRKFRRVMEANQRYSEEIASLINALFARLESDDRPYVASKDATDDLYVVVHSNLGLCAAYNNNLFSFVKENISKEHTTILVVGHKGEKSYENDGYTCDQSFISVNEHLEYEDILKLGNYLTNVFNEGKFKSIHLVFTHYQNSIKFIPQDYVLLPIENRVDNVVSGYEPIFDPNVKTLIEELTPIYINSVLYQKIVESQVSEQASRRTAMENASDNADELIGQLTLEYNKARQASITQEISEIVSGKN